MSDTNILSVVTLEEWDEEEREPGRIIVSIRPAGDGLRFTVSPDRGIFHGITEHGPRERKCLKTLIDLCGVVSVDTDHPTQVAAWVIDSARAKGKVRLITSRTVEALNKHGARHE